jgi:hypothetical protein
MGICERLPDSVFTEFRLPGIPYVFCASVSSVFRAESPKIPRDFDFWENCRPDGVL